MIVFFNFSIEDYDDIDIMEQFVSSHAFDKDYGYDSIKEMMELIYDCWIDDTDIIVTVEL